MTRLKTVLRRMMRPIRDTDRFSLTPAGEAALDTANAALEAARDTQAKVTQSVRQAYDGPADGQPWPEWVRGECPQCGGPVVANSYYVGGKGYIIVFECWAGLSEEPTCAYRKVP